MAEVASPHASVTNISAPAVTKSQQQQPLSHSSTTITPRKDSFAKEFSKGTSSHHEHITINDQIQFHSQRTPPTPLGRDVARIHTGNSPGNFTFANRAQQFNSDISPTTQQLQQQQQHQHMHLTASMAGFGGMQRGLPSMATGGAGMDISNYERPLSPQDLAGVFDPSLDGSLMDPAPRKRSKVSRACDECRRKKIRCDATSESGVEQCSSCKRVGTKCSFSRVPMKRGPSKGYIKELADRLNTLENSISTGEMYGREGDSSPVQSDSTSPPPMTGPVANSGVNKLPRKRTLSASSEFSQVSVVNMQQQHAPHSGMQLQPLNQQQLPGSHRTERLPSIDSFHTSNSSSKPQQLQRQLPPPHPQSLKAQQQHHGQQGPGTPMSMSSGVDGSASYRSQQSPNGNPAVPFWKNENTHDIGRRQSISGISQDNMDVQRTPVQSLEQSLDWDEAAIDQYYDIIHPTFPILPHSKARLRSTLESCGGKVRDAMLLALKCTVRSNPSSTLRPTQPSDARLVNDWIMQAHYDYPANRSLIYNLLHLQTLIFMVIDSDNHGPAALRCQAGPPKAVWLGAAIGLAYTLKLHRNIHTHTTDDDGDSDEKLGQRAWWALVVLDRWHAISTSSPLMIPDSSVILLPEDQVLLGLAPFHITRLSIILGHLAETLTTIDESVSGAGSNTYVSKLLRGELERFRESVDSVWGALNLVHLAYWHVKLLTLRHNTMCEPTSLIGPAIRIATILDSALTPVTPMNHHFAALAIITLIDLADVSDTREEAIRGINLIAEALQKRRGISTREDSRGWDRAIKDFIERRSNSKNRTISGSSSASNPYAGHGSLQHLAELAVGDRSPTPVNGQGLETGMLKRYGYLGCLAL